MKRICFCVSDVSACGGTERVCLKISNELCKRGYDIHVISLASSEKPFFDYDKRIRFHTLLTSYIDKKLIHKRWYKIWKLNMFLNYIGADIVIDTTLGDIISTVVLSRSETYISWVHFNFGFTTKYPPHINSIERIIKRNGNIVVLTDSDREMYIDYGVSPNRINVIHNPITFDIIPKNEKREKKVISVGRFAPEKGFDLLLRAWALVEQSDNEWSLEIWGDDGRYENNLYELKEELDLKRASLHGVTNEVGTLMQQSSIYVLSSRNESFGLVLIEASVCKLPLIAFDCPNGPRVIIADGVNGILVPPEDVGRLATAILNLIKDDEKRAQMGEKAFEMSNRFSVEDIVNQWEVLFQKI